jgi:hypothetical protein
MCQAVLANLELLNIHRIAQSSRKVVRIAFSVDQMSSVRPKQSVRPKPLSKMLLSSRPMDD